VLTFAEQFSSHLEGFFGKKKSVLTAVVAGIAVLGLATTLWLRPAKELPTPVAQLVVLQPEVVTPVMPSAPTDPATTSVATLAYRPARLFLSRLR